MDVRRLDLLRELAARGSVTAVAAATHRTPSAVSQQLKVLEREAGMPLTVRSGRGIALTSAGQALARSATDVAVALERASAVWDEFRNHPSGEVTLLTFPTAGQMLLPRLLADVAQVPGLRLSCTDLDPEVRRFADLTSDYDIVLAYAMRGDRNWGGRGLTVQPLMSEPLDIGVSLRHRLAGRSYLTPADIVNDTWIGVPTGFPFERVMHTIEELGGGPITTAQRFSDMRIVEALIASDAGIGLVPRYTSGWLNKQEIVAKPLRGVDTNREIVALMRPDQAQRLAVRTVVNMLRDHSLRVSTAQLGENNFPESVG